VENAQKYLNGQKMINYSALMETKELNMKKCIVEPGLEILKMK